MRRLKEKGENSKMRIVACVKQVPDERNMATDPVTGSLLRDTAGSIPNPDDAYALAMARAISESLHGQVQSLDAITMGPRQSRSSLRQALSYGFDHAYQLTDSRFAGSDVLATARALALAIRKTGGADLVFCGEKSADGDTGQVPAELSVLLEASFLPFVTEIIDVDHDGITVRSKMDDVEYVIESSLPAVIQVKAGAVKSAPASFRDRIEALKKPIVVLSAEDLSSETPFGYRHSPTRVRKMVAPDRTRVPSVYRGDDALTQFRRILEEHENMDDRSADSPHPQSDARQVREIDTCCDQVPDEPVAVYVEAHRDGFQNGLELLSRLQACGAKTIYAVTLIPGDPASSDESMERVLSETVGEELYLSLLRNVDTLTIMEASGAAVTSEECAYRLTRYLEKRRVGLCFLSATDHGRTVGPLTAAALKTGITADVTELRYVSGQWEQVRPAYGGQVYATIVSPEHRPVMATVRPRIFDVDLQDDGRGIVAVERSQDMENRRTRVLSMMTCERETTVEEAKRLLVIGGAITMEDERDRLILFAKKHNLEWSVTRALVQGYLAPHERQIGVSGLTVAPDLAILVGVSGSVQTMSGLRRAEKIVAINRDESAPVFDNVDIALIGQWQEYIESLS
ncbi:MAG TPA: FAD-binding protein [Bacillota bacterium]|jgi:electron transfer flavoprotein alpha subunit|nr:FAD-binding protein [Bacillota bacterium]HQC49203.1 FAD-binding protein [Bacillota bacterium]